MHQKKKKKMETRLKKKDERAYFPLFFSCMFTFSGFLGIKLNTVKSVLEAAASNHFDVIFGHNLLSKKSVLLRLLFEGGFYLRAASNTDDTVCVIFGHFQAIHTYYLVSC